MSSALSVIHSAVPVDESAAVAVDESAAVAGHVSNPLRAIHGSATRNDSASKPHDAVKAQPVIPSPVTAPVADVEHFARQLDAEKVLLVPPGVTINGNIDTNGLASLIISGTVNGNVTAGSGTVIVRESGVVVGTINSDDCVVVAGKVTGDKAPAIVTKGLWMLAETGQVRGDVAYSRHRAYEGGLFSGRAIPFSEYEG